MAIKDLIATAEKWRSENNPVAELSTLGTTLARIMSDSVRNYQSAQEALSFYSDWCVAERIERIISLFQDRLPGINDGTDSAAVGNPSIHPTMACLCWVIDRDDLARQLIDLTLEYLGRNAIPAVDYRILHAIDAFTQGIIKEPVTFKGMKKIEKPHVLYAELMNICIDKSDASKLLKKIDKNFIDRNNDRKLLESAPLVLGTGQAPVKWDFWKEGILAYARRHYDYQNK